MHDECTSRAGRDRPFAGFEWLVAKKEVQGRLPLPLRGLVSVDARGVANFKKWPLDDHRETERFGAPKRHRWESGRPGGTLITLGGSLLAFLR